MKISEAAFISGIGYNTMGILPAVIRQRDLRERGGTGDRGSLSYRTDITTRHIVRFRGVD